MRLHLRAGISVSLLITSFFSLGILLSNARFVDDARLGLLLLLGAPVVGGAVLGALCSRPMDWLARAGSSEDPRRAAELLWAVFAGGLAFSGTFVILPAFLSLYTHSENWRFSGAFLIASAFCLAAVWIIRESARRSRLWTWPVLAALPLTLVIAGSVSWGPRPAGARTLVLALPGLSWNVAEDLIERGEMPALANLRRGGAWGELHSGPGMASSVWTSIATGKTSDAHGVSSFGASWDDVRSRRIWEIMEDRGWSVGLYGWPVTWPPRPVQGFVVPGSSDPGWDTHPRELRFIRELAVREKTRQKRTWGLYSRFGVLAVRYGARLTTLVEAASQFVRPPGGPEIDAARLFEQRKLRARLNCDYFVELLRRNPVDFAAFHCNIVHTAQAYFWKYHEPERFAEISLPDVERYGESVHDAYRIADEFIDKVLRRSGPMDLVVVVSDHGAEARVEPHQQLTLRIEPALTRMRLQGSVEATNLAARTYLRVHPDDEGSRRRVQRLFRTARLDRAGVRAFDARLDEWGNVEVTVRSEVASAMEDYLLFQGGRCPVSEVIRPVEFTESSQIRNTGALVLNGEGVQPGSRIPECHMLDLVPTLLVLNRLDLAADLPGDVIKTALEPAILERVPGMVATYDPVPFPAD